MTKAAAVILFVTSSILAVWSGITLASQQGGGAGVSGSYAADLNVQSDLCGHDPFIWQADPPPHNVPLQVVVDGQNIAVTGSAPWVNVSGTLGATGDFEAQGTGQVGPNPQATVQLVGTWNGQTLTGAYTMGAGPNELPPCTPPGQPMGHYPAVYGIKGKATPTAMVTPTGTPPKLYSIIVIKLNDDTLQPVPDWRMNLYAGFGCMGNPITSRLTDADGLADFEGLDPGSYSVLEKSQAGWNPVGPECQNVTIAGAAGPFIPPCPIQPDADFPQPGCDSFLSAARVNVRNNATNDVTGASLGGPVLIRRNNKPTDKDGDGLDEVNTEIVFMQLSGTGVTVRESPTRQSLGKIEEQANITPGVMNFPANSYFDVFFEVDVGGLTLHNDTPFRLACKIDAVPPYKCFYEPPIKTPIDLLDDNDVKIAKLIHGLHLPIPPNETVIIFTNRPKLTPTATATPTAAQTPGATTPTPTATNPPPNGNCAKIAQDVTFQNKVWDQWTCGPLPPSVPYYNRIDIFVGSAQQNPILSAAHFVCQSTNEKVAGVFKAHKNDVNPGTNLPNSDVWSGDFNEKCGGKSSAGIVYVQPVDPANHPVIVGVAFTDTQPPTATPPQPTNTPTPTPRPRNGDANKDGSTNPIDATLVLQYSAGLLTPINPDTDVNGDGMTNPIDGQLILQFSAALIPGLPI